MGSLNRLTDGLNYELELAQERINLIDKLMSENKDIVDYYNNHYNPHISQDGLLSEETRMGKDLESIATYILNSKDEKEDSDLAEIITDYKKKRNSIREASIENLMKVNDFKRNENNRSIIKVPKIKVNKDDRAVHLELKNSGEVISHLTDMIKSRRNSIGEILSEKEVRKLKWIRTDIQKDEIAVKTELKKYIYFNSITKQEKDMQALSYIRFDDPEIMRILIEDYSDLKKQSWDDIHGYMKTILIAFEDIIDKSNLEDYMRDIMLWKIDGIQYDEVIKNLDEKYNIKFTKPKLSKITRDVLPMIFVETYKQQKEDWLYTYIMKGKYKACSSCKVNYLATTKYFNPDKYSKTGLRPVCKNCRKKQYQKQSQAKNQ